MRTSSKLLALLISLLVVGVPLSARGGPSGGTTVTVAQGIDPETLDPHMDTLSSSQAIFSNIYDSLVSIDARGDMTPGLATSWKFINDTTLELTLRRGVQFHNGEPFAADDVVFTIKRMLAKDRPVRTNSWVAGIVKDVVMVNDHTVRIITEQPDAPLLRRVSQWFMIPKDTFERVGAREFGSNPAGTGPFQFVEWAKNERVVLKAFERYWRGRPRIDQAVFRAVPEEFARLAALRTGGVDIIANLPPERIAEVEQAPNLKIASVHSSRLIFVGMNTWELPFSLKRVRKAMNYAVNPDELIRTILAGRAHRNPGPVNQIVFGYCADLRPYPFDPQRARELLAEAGYPNGFDVTLASPSGRYLKDKEIALAVAGQLARVGVRARVEVLEWAVYWGRWLRTDHKGMYLLGFGGGVLDADYIMGGHFHSKRRGLYYNNGESDRLIELGMRTTDEAERRKVYCQLQKLLQDEAPWIFLYDQEDLYGLNKRVIWQPRSDERIWLFDARVQ